MKHLTPCTKATSSAALKLKTPTAFSINAMRAKAAQPPIISIGSVGNHHVRSAGGREGSFR